MLRPMRVRWLRPGLVSTLLGASLCAGCLASPHSEVAGKASPGPTECLPAPLVVTPSTLPIGGRVRLTAPAANCDLQYGQGKTYTVTLVMVGRSKLTSLGRASVLSDGSFAVAFTLPLNLSPGEAYLRVVLARVLPGFFFGPAKRLLLRRCAPERYSLLIEPLSSVLAGLAGHDE
jgi:hypothetical protein